MTSTKPLMQLDSQGFPVFQSQFTSPNTHGYRLINAQPSAPTTALTSGNGLYNFDVDLAVVEKIHSLAWRFDVTMTTADAYLCTPHWFITRVDVYPQQGAISQPIQTYYPEDLYFQTVVLAEDVKMGKEDLNREV